MHALTELTPPPRQPAEAMVRSAGRSSCKWPLRIIDRDGVAAQLRIVARDFRRLALTHPNVVPLLVTRPLATLLGQRPPGMLRPLEDVLVLLTSAGFTGVDALHIYRVLFGYLHGHILTE